MHYFLVLFMFFFTNKKRREEQIRMRLAVYVWIFNTVKEQRKKQEITYIKAQSLSTGTVDFKRADLWTLEISVSNDRKSLDVILSYVHGVLLSYLAGMSPYISLKIKKRHYKHHMIEAHKYLITWISDDIFFFFK